SVEEIHVDTARPVVAGRGRLRDMAIFARPADPPLLHLENTGWRFLAEELRQTPVAELASGGKCVLVMMGPVIRRLRAQRDGNRHLRHHRGAATADQAAIDKEHAAPGAR